MKKIALSTAACALIACLATPAEAQYAVGHRVFGAGTAFGGGYSKMDYQFLDDASDDGLPNLFNLGLGWTF